MSIVLFILLCVFNVLVALGIKVFFDEHSALLKNKPFRLFLLFPPVAIVLLSGILVWGISFTIYLLFDDYLS